MDEQMALVPKDTTEDAMITLWIKTKDSEHTRRNYRRHIDRFRSFLGKPLAQTTLFDLQAFVEHMRDEGVLNQNSQKVILDVIKSFLSYAHTSGLFKVNVGKAYGALKKVETISERILSEYEVQSMIMNEQDPRNHAILRVLYGGGLRVAELCNLRWKDVIDRGDAVQVSVIGKGNKKRHVLLTPEISAALLALGEGEDDAYVFRSKDLKSAKLTTRAVQYMVKNAAKRAGIKNWKHVSPHWLRHSHATHTISHGAPLAVVKETLGHSNIAVTDTYIHVRPGESSARYLPKF